MLKRHKDYLFIFLLVIFGFFLYGLPSFYVPDETRYSEVAREMLSGGSFIVPHVNGIVFFHKPPIIYWLTSFFMNIFGENTWGGRLVNPVLLLFCLMFVYYAVRLVLKSRAVAMLSTVITMTTIMILFVGRYLDIDLGIAVFLNLTLLSYWISLNYDDNYRKSTCWLIIAFVFSGLAVMTKGLMGIVFPMAIVGIYSIVMLEWKRLFDIRLYLGLIIVLVISVPWIVAVDDRYHGFAYYYIMVQQVLRYATDSQDRDISIIIYFLASMAAFFPWTFFLPQALRKFFSKKRFKDRKNNRLEWFLFIWGSFIFVFFAMSKSFLFGYLAPLILPFGILIAIYINRLSKRNFSKFDKLSIIVPTFIFALLPIASVVVLALPIVKGYIWQVAILLLPIFFVSIVVVFIVVNAIKKQELKKIVVCFSVVMIFVANFGYGVGQYLDGKNVEKFAEDINIIAKKYPNIKLYASHRFYEIGFYTKKIPIMINDEQELDYAKSFKNSGSKEYMMSYDKFINTWNSSKKLDLIVIRNKHNIHLRERDHAFADYKKDIDRNKFFILDKTNYATLVANKNISI
ncbi:MULTISPECIES: ArnT family glycosyltransferase [unclassified Francisella]|uniref:ArnT family glycosyltransferase n=1 Tax=unclassified Francisella TaxID=2610885 RepID=UPI002E338BE0|nr:MULTISPECIES: glycosyltransferase family 39 protein [unclassified Francisella]MED7819907.1 glycosyltransferase family 39 protein [Francisella sp. 19S2-4]MED7830717.1 glycosyltransferase family 39 protein [Francisella sp. 19S2-10]